MKIVNRKSAIRNLLWCVVVILVAVALVGSNVLLGLSAAVAGGIVFGLLLFK